MTRTRTPPPAAKIHQNSSTKLGGASVAGVVVSGVSEGVAVGAVVEVQFAGVPTAVPEV